MLAAADVVFPAVHGPDGEDGSLAALAALAGVPVVGSPVGAGALAMDKWATKLVAQASGVAVAPGTLLTRADVTAAPAPTSCGPRRPDALDRQAGGRRVELRGEPGRRSRAAGRGTRRGVRTRRPRARRALVTGREVDVAVLERPTGELVVGPPLEVLNDADGFFDADTKYDGSARFVLPAPLEPAVAERIDVVARTCSPASAARPRARRLLRHTGGRGHPQRGEHDARTDRAVAAPEDVRGVGIDYPELLSGLVETARRPSVRSGTRVGAAR